MLSRRAMLTQSAVGFGWLAFSALHAAEARGPLAPKATHFPAKAKRVIFLFMNGGPSHLDTFDWKPVLAKNGPGGRSKHLAPVFKFSPAGKSGIPISEVFPNLAKVADDLCVLNGMKTYNAGHQQAVVTVHTGSERFVRPSLGAWCVYGLGSESQELPGFVTIDPIGDQGGAQNYGSAFLPAHYQGVKLGGTGGGIPDLTPRLDAASQRKQLDFIQRSNARLLQTDPGHAELEGVIGSYEMAFRMQTSVPDAVDLSREPESVRELYGLNDGRTEAFGTRCLLARRLAEKGVRFIQLTSNGWDHHNNLRQSLGDRATSIDKPIAGLITDLKQRGMLKDTLIVWGGEFGRTAHDDKGDGNGRGHANRGYTMWMAGGGVKGGLRYGATDDMGIDAVEGIMDTPDLHATILHLLGLDHEQLTFPYAGRDFRLTDTSGEVAKGILA